MRKYLIYTLFCHPRSLCSLFEFYLNGAHTHPKNFNVEAEENDENHIIRRLRRSPHAAETVIYERHSFEWSSQPLLIFHHPWFIVAHPSTRIQAAARLEPKTHWIMAMARVLLRNAVTYVQHQMWPRGKMPSKYQLKECVSKSMPTSRPNRLWYMERP